MIVRKYNDRLTEKHGYRLNSRSREIDVRIIDQLHGRKQRIDNEIAPPQCFQNQATHGCSEAITSFP